MRFSQFGPWGQTEHIDAMFIECPESKGVTCLCSIHTINSNKKHHNNKHQITKLLLNLLHTNTTNEWELFKHSTSQPQRNKSWKEKLVIDKITNNFKYFVPVGDKILYRDVNKTKRGWVSHARYGDDKSNMNNAYSNIYTTKYWTNTTTNNNKINRILFQQIYQ